MNKGVSFVTCGICGREHLTPTALSDEVMQDDNIETYNFICSRCDTHDDCCNFRECFWRGSNVFCSSCEHKAMQMDIEKVNIVGASYAT